MKQVPVLIAGGGPVGMTLACELSRRGIACLLVERNPAKAPEVVGQFVRKLLANRRAQYGREL